jgi:hypothetical protein
MSACDGSVDCEDYVYTLSYNATSGIEGDLPGDFQITEEEIINSSLGTWRSADSRMELTLWPTGPLTYQDPPSGTKCGGQSASLPASGSFQEDGGTLVSCEGVVDYNGAGTEGDRIFGLILGCEGTHLEGVVKDNGTLVHLRDPELIDLDRQ